MSTIFSRNSLSWNLYIHVILSKEAFKYIQSLVFLNFYFIISNFLSQDEIVAMTYRIQNKTDLKLKHMWNCTQDNSWSMRNTLLHTYLYMRISWLCTTYLLYNRQNLNIVNVPHSEVYTFHRPLSLTLNNYCIKRHTHIIVISYLWTLHIQNHTEWK